MAIAWRGANKQGGRGGVCECCLYKRYVPDI